MGQFFYFQGLHLASPSMARATTNLSPGITFAIAAAMGYVRSPSPRRRTLYPLLVCEAGAPSATVSVTLPPCVRFYFFSLKEKKVISLLLSPLGQSLSFSRDQLDPCTLLLGKKFLNNGPTILRLSCSL